MLNIRIYQELAKTLNNRNKVTRYFFSDFIVNQPLRANYFQILNIPTKN